MSKTYTRIEATNLVHELLAAEIACYTVAEAAKWHRRILTELFQFASSHRSRYTLNALLERRKEMMSSAFEKDLITFLMEGPPRVSLPSLTHLYSATSNRAPEAPQMQQLMAA